MPAGETTALITPWRRRLTIPGRGPTYILRGTAMLTSLSTRKRVTRPSSSNIRTNPDESVARTTISSEVKPTSVFLVNIHARHYQWPQGEHLCASSYPFLGRRSFLRNNLVGTGKVKRTVPGTSTESPQEPNSPFET